LRSRRGKNTKLCLLSRLILVLLSICLGSLPGSEVQGPQALPRDVLCLRHFLCLPPNILHAAAELAQAVLPCLCSSTAGQPQGGPTSASEESAPRLLSASRSPGSIASLTPCASCTAFILVQRRLTRCITHLLRLAHRPCLALHGPALQGKLPNTVGKVKASAKQREGQCQAGTRRQLAVPEVKRLRWRK